MESVGFKEWAIVCEALGRGEQCVLLRKGGLAEGRKGFAFQHSRFFLFPTFFHEQVEKTRWTESEIPLQKTGQVEIKFLARLELAAMVTSLEMAEALKPFHILKPEVVRERFEYDSPGIHVAFVRVFRISTPWVIPELPAYGGCRSWVKLTNVPEGLKFESVLSDDEHHERVTSIEALISSPFSLSN